MSTAQSDVVSARCRIRAAKTRGAANAQFLAPNRRSAGSDRPRPGSVRYNSSSSVSGDREVEESQSRQAEEVARLSGIVISLGTWMLLIKLSG